MLAFGTPAINACEAAEQLNGVLRVGVWDARFAKPVDVSLVTSLVERGIPILTIEDHSIVGGFGSAVLEAAHEAGLSQAVIVRHGLPDRWVLQDSRARQLAEVELDTPGIVRLVAAVANGSASEGRDESRMRVRVTPRATQHKPARR